MSTQGGKHFKNSHLSTFKTMSQLDNFLKMLQRKLKSHLYCLNINYALSYDTQNYNKSSCRSNNSNDSVKTTCLVFILRRGGGSVTGQVLYDSQCSILEFFYFFFFMYSSELRDCPCSSVGSSPVSGLRGHSFKSLLRKFNKFHL